MKKVKIAFFDAKSYDQDFFSQANQEYNYEIKYFSPRLNRDTVALTKNYKVLCAFVNDQLNAQVLEALKENGINLIALRSAGYNNVDLKAAYKNINIVRVPAYSPHAVAEHAIALMLSLNRNIHRAYSRVRDLNFSITGFVGFDMNGKTAGVIGTGKIGIESVKKLKGLGLKVLAFDPKPDQKLAQKIGFQYVELNQLYQDSDIITLHCPLTPQTHHIINQDSLSKMKKGVMIINTGRGQLIDSEALVASLKDKHVGSAGLDVYEEESEYFFEDWSNSVLPDDTLARLLTFPNVIVTSHQAFFTKEALENIAQTTLQNIKDFFDGKELKNEVCYQCEEKGQKSCTKNKEGRCF